ncbi:MAG: hypothetical protein HY242_09895 [Afipia sp.]|nr:hypothetical protein [Afipia sp.]
MRVSQRLIAASVLAALSLALAGCGTNGSFDPTDMLDFLDTKKKLPGERKPVFPGGVPGVEQGVPKELYKGAQQQQQQDIPPVAAVEPAPAKRGAKPASVRPSVAPSADQPAPEAQQDDSAAATDNAPAAPPSPKMKKPKRRSITAPDSDQPQQTANPFPTPR